MGIQKNLYEKVNILEYISKLNIKDETRRNLISYIVKSEQGEDSEAYIFGMALALQNEGIITPEDFIAIVMREKKVREEVPWWKSFWKGIGS